MNKFIGIGRLTRDPDVRYTQGENSMCVARYTLAIDRHVKRDQNQQTADFISCLAFGKNGEFAEKYLHKGMKIAVTGRIKTGSYTNREGQKVYTTDIVVEDQEFAESKSAQQTGGVPQQKNGQPDNIADEGGFMDIPDSLDEDLPFH